MTCRSRTRLLAHSPGENTRGPWHIRLMLFRNDGIFSIITRDFGGSAWFVLCSPAGKSHNQMILVHERSPSLLPMALTINARCVNMGCGRAILSGTGLFWLKMSSINATTEQPESASAANPPGQSSPGIWDLTGNVWELIGNYSDERKGTFMLRGRSWTSDTHSAHLSNYSDVRPDNSWQDIGFRILILGHQRANDWIFCEYWLHTGDA